MNAHDRLVDYYHRLMGCTAEDAVQLATHIMATLERRGHGRDGADVVELQVSISTKPPRRDERRTVSDGFLTRSKEPLHE